MNAESQTGDGRFAYEGLDRVIHERARLSLLTSLMTQPKGLSFGDLKQLCSLTDGNLNRHLHVLEEEGMVEILKKTERNRSLTVCLLTDSGKVRYIEYLTELESVIKDAAKVLEAQRSTTTVGGLKPSLA